MSTADMILWSMAIALASYATWLQLPRPRSWDPTQVFLAFSGRAAPPADVDPTILLGVGCAWDVVATWRSSGQAEAIQTALRRRFSDTRLVWFDDEPRLDLPEIPAIALPNLNSPLQDLERALTRPHQKLVLAASRQSMALLTLLHATPGLRDRVRAVLLVEPDRDTAWDPAWLEANFTHEAMDVEVARIVPYLVVGREGLLPSPALPASRRRSFEVLTLGSLPEGADDRARTGRVLSLLFAALE